MKKKNLLRGLTSVFAAILAISIVMTNTAMSYASMLNSALGISTGKFVHKDGAAKEEPIFYASDYGDVNHLTQENLDALLTKTPSSSSKRKKAQYFCATTIMHCL